MKRNNRSGAAESADEAHVTTPLTKSKKKGSREVLYTWVLLNCFT